MAPLPRVGSNLALVALMGAFVTASDFAAGGPEPSARLLFPGEPVADMDEEGRERTLFVIRGWSPMASPSPLPTISGGGLSRWTSCISIWNKDA